MEKMAESTTTLQQNIIRAELLFCNTLWRARTGSATWHQHPHWQVEIALGGPIAVRTEGETTELARGDVALLPAASFHEFGYPQARVGWITLRFVITGLADVEPGAYILRHGGVVDGFVAVLRGLLEGLEWPPPSNARAAAEHCLAGLVAFVCMPQVDVSRREGQPAVIRADEYIAANADRRTTVEEVAQIMGYSVSHASALYRQETGHSLKWAIDQARAEAAQRMLAYSDERIGDIAEAMGFVDVYAFSRFIKRLTGKSPRQFRKVWFRAHG